MQISWKGTLVGVALLLSAHSVALAQAITATTVGIAGAKFTINGALTYPGTSIEGLLMNSRMINAIFDDDSANTVGMWAYSDTGVWDPQRNTSEFIAALPSYTAKGLKAFTLGLQGGKPVRGSVSTPHPWIVSAAAKAVKAFTVGLLGGKPAGGSVSTPHPWIVSAFNPDGSLKPTWLARADQVIRAADQNGLVVILQYFYQHQEDRFIDDNAVLVAADNATDWVLSQGYTNVLIEVANESSDREYRRALLRPDNVQQVIARVQARSGGRLKVSTSFIGGIIPPDAVIRQSDYVLLHGNGETADGIRSMIDAIRATPAYRSNPKPIIFNEDSAKIDNLNAAVEKGASWGYHDGSDFQDVPVSWTINTAKKQSFFNRVAQLANGLP